jgi:hypothetical protein
MNQDEAAHLQGSLEGFLLGGCVFKSGLKYGFMGYKMAKARALLKKIIIPQISASENFTRLLNFLEEKYGCKRIEDKGVYVVGHLRITLQRDQEIDVVVFTSDTILMRASPRMPSELFDEICSNVEKLANQAITPVSVTRPLTILRAKTILDYASKLNLND